MQLFLTACCNIIRASWATMKERLSYRKGTWKKNYLYKTVCQVLNYLFSSAVMLKTSLKNKFLRDSGPYWPFKCNKKRSNKHFEKLRHRFLLETITSSKVSYSKKSNIWMLRYKASCWNGHFLGKLFDLSPWKIHLKRHRGKDRIREMVGERK